MLELVSLIFEDDALTPGKEDNSNSAAGVSENVSALIQKGDAASETAAVRLLIKETGYTLREALRVIESVKEARA